MHLHYLLGRYCLHNLITCMQILEDKGCRRRVLSLRVKCKEHEAGCSWKGELRDIEVNNLWSLAYRVTFMHTIRFHYCLFGIKVHRVTCPCQMVECTNQGCTMKVRRRDLNSHQQDVCEWRLVECTYCRVPHPHAEQQVTMIQSFRLTHPPLVSRELKQMKMTRLKNNVVTTSIATCEMCIMKMHFIAKSSTTAWNS